MTPREPAPLRHLRRWISRGYQPGTAWRRPVEYVHADGSVAARLATWPPQPPAGVPSLAFVLPTHLRRYSASRHQAWLRELLAQLAEAAEAVPGARITVLVGMQWMRREDRDEAVARLRLLAGVAGQQSAVHFVGLSLPGPGKVSTLNAGIAVAEAQGLTAVGWLDDDIRLEPGCLANLVRDFAGHGCRGAVGATKVPHARPYATSRLLHRLKAITATATNYPHGCCLLVELPVVSGGIPDRYVCDDGYVCFRLLDPDAADPLHRLRLVPDARCHYEVAGPAGQSGRRIRRLLLNHVIYLADWSYPVARYYFRDILFPGMWPLTGFDASAGRSHGVAKSAITWVYFGWFARTAAELYLRGLVRRPLREVRWAEYVAPGSPDRSGPHPLTEASA
ncbi:hypothetical protein [Actinoplanes teichomyceticus]|uniref:Glycosyltransferase n=1 Tax=Actinoplanes teichomyceticus TaxID=1867 RepID=A0A1B1ESM5_ACTTI|nr:hypothetical protein [Actinoplanes teichomyceticus]ANQ31713.1 glycosyltransferase [Actinoplanes teichomyceticus]TWG14688.1 hypothetical protein FHX34_104994 [Actinoplanes teichomyceticus]GIF10091.1 hypothetical protein Ate01nite_01230 [Actinoplanes teichomyceticus]